MILLFFGYLAFSKLSDYEKCFSKALLYVSNSDLKLF